MSDKDVLNIIRAIFAAAGEKNQAVSVAVAGADGEVIGFLSMDGALIISRKISQAKAHSAVVFERDTMYWEKRNPPLDTADLCDSNFTGLGGGVVVSDGLNVLGGIGVSGGKSEDDEALAIVGREFIGKSIPRFDTNMD